MTTPESKKLTPNSTFEIRITSPTNMSHSSHANPSSEGQHDPHATFTAPSSLLEASRGTLASDTTNCAGSATPTFASISPRFKRVLMISPTHNNQNPSGEYANQISARSTSGSQDNGRVTPTPSVGSQRSGSATPRSMHPYSNYIYSPLHTPSNQHGLRSSPLAMTSLALAALAESNEGALPQSTDISSKDSQEVLQLAQQFQRNMATLRSENADLREQLDTSVARVKLLTTRCDDYAAQIVMLEQVSKLGRFAVRKPSPSATTTGDASTSPNHDHSTTTTTPSSSGSTSASVVSPSTSSVATQTADTPEPTTTVSSEKHTELQDKLTKTEESLTKVTQVLGCALALLEPGTMAKSILQLQSSATGSESKPMSILATMSSSPSHGDQVYAGSGAEFISPMLEVLCKSYPSLWDDVKKYRLEHQCEHAKLIALARGSSQNVVATELPSSQPDKSCSADNDMRNAPLAFSALDSSSPGSSTIALSSFDDRTLSTLPETTHLTLASSAPHSQHAPSRFADFDQVASLQYDHLKVQLEEWKARFQTLDDEHRALLDQKLATDAQVVKLQVELEQVRSHVPEPRPTIVSGNDSTIIGFVTESQPGFASETPSAAVEELRQPILSAPAHNSRAIPQQCAMTPKLQARGKAPSRGHGRSASGNASDFDFQATNGEDGAHLEDSTNDTRKSNVSNLPSEHHPSDVGIADVQIYLHPELGSVREADGAVDVTSDGFEAAGGRRTSLTHSKLSRSSMLSSAEVDTLLEYAIQITTPFYTILDNVAQNEDPERDVETSDMPVFSGVPPSLVGEKSGEKIVNTEGSIAPSSSDRSRVEECGSIAGLMTMTGTLAQRIRHQLRAERLARRACEKDYNDLKLKLASSEAEVKALQLVEKANRNAELAKIQAEEALRNASASAERDTERSAWLEQRSELVAKAARAEGELVGIRQQLDHAQGDLVRERERSQRAETTLIQVQTQFADASARIQKLELELQIAREHEQTLHSELALLRSASSKTTDLVQELQDARSTLTQREKELLEQTALVTSLRSQLEEATNSAARDRTTATLAVESEAASKQEAVQLRQRLDEETATSTQLRAQLASQHSNFDVTIRRLQADCRDSHEQVKIMKAEMAAQESSFSASITRLTQAAKESQRLLKQSLEMVATSEITCTVPLPDSDSSNRNNIPSQAPFVSAVRFKLNSSMDSTVMSDVQQFKKALVGATLTLSRPLYQGFETSRPTGETLRTNIANQIANLTKVLGEDQASPRLNSRSDTHSMSQGERLFEIDVVVANAHPQIATELDISDELPPLLNTDTTVLDTSVAAESEEEKKVVVDTSDELISSFASTMAAKIVEARAVAGRSATHLSSTPKQALSVTAPRTREQDRPKSPIRQVPSTQSRPQSAVTKPTRALPPSPPPRTPVPRAAVPRTSVPRPSSPIVRSTSPIGPRTNSQLSQGSQGNVGAARTARIPPTTQAALKSNLTSSSGLVTLSAPGQAKHSTSTLSRNDGVWEADEFYNSKEPPKRNSRMSAVTSTYTAPVGAAAAAFAPSSQLGSEILSSMRNGKSTARPSAPARR